MNPITTMMTRGPTPRTSRTATRRATMRRSKSALVAAVAVASMACCVAAIAKPQRHCVTALEAHERTRDEPRDAQAPSPRPCPTLLAHDDDGPLDGSAPRVDGTRTTFTGTTVHG